MDSIATVCRTIREHEVASPAHCFAAGCLLVVAITETFGPFFGYPTVSGHIFAVVNLQPKDTSPQILALLLAPQILVMGLAGYFVSQTSWLNWLRGLINRSEGVSLPEIHLRETLLGLLAGIILEYLVGPVIGAAAPNPLLPTSEYTVILLTLVVITIAVVFHPKVHFALAPTDHENTIFWIIPRAHLPVEISLDQTSFFRSRIFLAGRSTLRLCHGQVLRLDSGEHWLLNLGVLEQFVSREDDPETVVLSTNIFVCNAHFSLMISQPDEGTEQTYDRRTFEWMINNFMNKPDIRHLLTQRLGIVMDRYIGVWDADFQARLDNFRIGILQTDPLYVRRADKKETESYETDLALSQPEVPGVAALTQQTQLPPTQLDTLRERIRQRLAQAAAYQAEWKHARDLVSSAREELPPLFHKDLIDYCHEQGGLSPENVEPLIKLASVSVRIMSSAFTEKASEGEKLIETEIMALTQELRDIEQKLADEQLAERNRRLDVVADKVRQMPIPIIGSKWGREMANAFFSLLDSDSTSAAAQSLRSGAPESPGLHQPLNRDSAVDEPA